MFAKNRAHYRESPCLYLMSVTENRRGIGGNRTARSEVLNEGTVLGHGVMYWGDMLIVRLLSRGLFSGRHNAIDNASVALLRPLNWFGGRRQLWQVFLITLTSDSRRHSKLLCRWASVPVAGSRVQIVTHRVNFKEVDILVRLRLLALERVVVF